MIKRRGQFKGIVMKFEEQEEFKTNITMKKRGSRQYIASIRNRLDDVENLIENKLKGLSQTLAQLQNTDHDRLRSVAYRHTLELKKYIQFMAYHLSIIKGNKSISKSKYRHHVELGIKNLIDPELERYNRYFNLINICLTNLNLPTSPPKSLDIEIKNVELSNLGTVLNTSKKLFFQLDPNQFWLLHNEIDTVLKCENIVKFLILDSYLTFYNHKPNSLDPLSKFMAQFQLQLKNTFENLLANSYQTPHLFNVIGYGLLASEYMFKRDIVKAKVYLGTAFRMGDQIKLNPDSRLPSFRLDILYERLLLVHSFAFNYAPGPPLSTCQTTLSFQHIHGIQFSLPTVFRFVRRNPQFTDDHTINLKLNRDDTFYYNVVKLYMKIYQHSLTLQKSYYASNYLPETNLLPSNYLSYNEDIKLLDIELPNFDCNNLPPLVSTGFVALQMLKIYLYYPLARFDPKPQLILEAIGWCTVLDAANRLINYFQKAIYEVTVLQTKNKCTVSLLDLLPAIYAILNRIFYFHNEKEVYVKKLHEIVIGLHNVVNSKFKMRFEDADLALEKLKFSWNKFRTDPVDYLSTSI